MNAKKVRRSLYKPKTSKKEKGKVNKITIFENVLVPLLIYGVELMKMSEKLKKTVDAFDNNLSGTSTPLTKEDKMRIKEIRREIKKEASKRRSKEQEEDIAKRVEERKAVIIKKLRDARGKSGSPLNRGMKKLFGDNGVLGRRIKKNTSGQKGLRNMVTSSRRSL